MGPLVALKAFLAVAFWGGSFVATKIVLRELSPINLIFARFAIGLVALASVVWLKREWSLLRARDLGWFLLLGFVGIFVHQMLQVNGLTSTTATNTGWMVALTPLFTALLARLLLREAFNPVQIGGLALAMSGALLVVSRGDLRLGSVDLPATRGDVLVFLSAPNWALFSVTSKRVLVRYPPSFTMALAMSLGWLMLLPLFIGSEGWQEFSDLSKDTWTGLLFLGLLCSGAAYAFWYDALNVAGAGQVASFLYLEPLVTLVVAMLLLDERPAATTLLGGGLILAGVWLVCQRRS